MRTCIPRSATAALTLTLGVLLAQTPAHADTFAGLAPVTNQALATIRGGFSMSFDFGQMGIALDMSQMTFVNGQLVPVQQIVDAAGGTVNLIQNGPGNGAGTVSPTDLAQGSSATGSALHPLAPGNGVGLAGSNGAASGLAGLAVPSVLMQTGLGNGATASLVSNVSPAMIGTVIQNGLDGQIIQNLNVLNVTVTSQALAQSVALQAMTQGALLRFLH